jgi:hypothetical protein
MKKISLIVELLILITILVSCEKFCTCTNPDTSNLTEIEINPDDECSDYSDSTIGDCE